MGKIKIKKKKPYKCKSALNYKLYKCELILLYVTLKTNTKDRFNFVHLNARSLCPDVKLDEFKYTFSNVNIHAIAVSETWFKTKDTMSRVNLHGYKLYRNDRHQRRGGGVAVYVKDNFKCRVLTKSERNAKVEYIFVQVSINNKNILYWICICSTIGK